jgi:hypothetical protein
MHATSVSKPSHAARARFVLPKLLLGFAGCCIALSGGCSEFVLEGIVSDRHSGRPIPGVQIDQNRAESWKNLGETDGKGRYWIMKSDVKGGGRVRLSKPGYHFTEMREGDFLTGQSFLLIPKEEDDDFENYFRQTDTKSFPD